MTKNWSLNKTTSNTQKTIMDKIKSETLNKFYNTGYTYDILLTISASGLKAVENTVIKEKHGAIVSGATSQMCTLYI